MKVALAIPCYRCEAQIPRVIAALDAKILARLDRVWVIDNLSPDGTVEAAVGAIAALGIGSKISVVRNRENYGLGGSHKAAFEAALREGLDAVAVLHGDDQGLAADLLRLFDTASEAPSAAAILGARFKPGAKLEGYSPVRIAGNLGLNTLYTLLSGRMTWDMGSGLNLFRMRPLADRAYLRFTDAFTFNMDLLLHYYRRGLELRTVPITWRETDQISNAKTLKVGWTALRTLLEWRIGREPEAPPYREYAFDRVG